GDVDRKHVAGCHALIRDGATLARGAQDVLEALGHPRLLPTPGTAAPRDPTASALLRALDDGARAFDEIVAASGVTPPIALAGLAMLELEGAIESCGGASYARVATALRGEDHGG
ncbi:MAG: hypothetical protein WA814_12565, partial [Candidatus Baltobacteraceae bacterium]